MTVEGDVEGVQRWLRIANRAATLVGRKPVSVGADELCLERKSGGPKKAKYAY